MWQADAAPGRDAAHLPPRDRGQHRDDRDAQHALDRVADQDSNAEGEAEQQDQPVREKADGDAERQEHARPREDRLTHCDRLLDDLQAGDFRAVEVVEVVRVLQPLVERAARRAELGDLAVEVGETNFSLAEMGQLGVLLRGGGAQGNDPVGERSELGARRR